MFLTLLLVLIILLNNTYTYIKQDNEITLLPACNPTGAKEVIFIILIFYLFMYIQSIIKKRSNSFLMVMKFTDNINFNEIYR